jgi:hypothetical protein
VNDRIPVFWAGQEPSQELKAVDGGALYRHLVAVSTPTTNRKRKRTEKYHAPKEVRRQQTATAWEGAAVIAPSAAANTTY